MRGALSRTRAGGRSVTVVDGRGGGGRRRGGGGGGGVSWSSLGSGMARGVHGLAVSDSDVYAGGYFTTAGGVYIGSGIAKWNGSSWSALGSGMGGAYPYVYVLAVSGSDLYAGGYFE